MSAQVARNEILLRVNNVRSKKGLNGSLHLLSTRMIWKTDPGATEAITVDFKYDDIKGQKISPEGKEKIQLQIVMVDGSHSTFHFCNPGGASAQLSDRDAVKETLQQLLPKFKRPTQMESEFDKKQRLMQSNPELLALYKELVVPQLISAADFWSNYAGQRGESLDEPTSSQQTGVASGFLSNIAQADGCNGIKLNLTADTMEAIFKTYPAVKRKHLEKVPHELSEEEFWTQFFQSHYFHRDRAVNPTPKELFSDCAKYDESYMSSMCKEGLSADFDLRQLIEQPNDMEGFGYKRVDEVDGSSSSAATGRSAVNQALVRRFNFHSTRVLDSFTGDAPGAAGDAQKSGTTGELSIGKAKPLSALIKGAHAGVQLEPPAIRNGAFRKSAGVAPSTAFTNGSAHESHVAAPASKMARLALGSECEDLASSSHAKIGIPLNFSRESIVRHGAHSGSSLHKKVYGSHAAESRPTLLSQSEKQQRADSLERQAAMLQETFSEPTNISDDHLLTLMGSDEAFTAMTDLSPGGKLIRATQLTLNESVAVDVRTEVQALYKIAAELLRHFWSAFPATTPELEEKVSRMYDTLKKFQQTKLSVFARKFTNTSPDSTENLTAHLNLQLQTAFQRYDAWVARRSAIEPK